MDDEFKWVIVGSGNMSRTYVTAIEKLEGMRVVGCVSRSGRRPENWPSDRPLEVAPSLGETKADFDGVILATPNGLHMDGALEAAALGKHVLTEKPLEITIHAMDRMTQACREAGVKLGVAYQRRVSPDNIVVKRLLSQKELGRVFACDMAVKFWRPQEYYDSAEYKGTWDIEGGGPFMQQASHNVDVYCWFFGLPVKVASLWDTFMHNMEAEDHGAAILRHADGMIGTIVCSTATKPGYSARMEIHGEAGSVVMVNDIIERWDVEGMENPSEAPEIDIHDGATSAAVTDTAGHEALLKDFVEAVREDREPLVPADSARMATELILDIYENRID